MALSMADIYKMLGKSVATDAPVVAGEGIKRLYQALQGVSASTAAAVDEYLKASRKKFSKELEGELTPKKVMKALLTDTTLRSMVPGQAGEAIRPILPKTPLEGLDVAERIVKGTEWKTPFKQLIEAPEKVSATIPNVNPRLLNALAMATQKASTAVSPLKPGQEVSFGPKQIGQAAAFSGEFATHPLNVIGAGLTKVAGKIPPKYWEKFFEASRGVVGKTAGAVSRLPLFTKMLEKAGKTPEDVESFFRYRFKRNPKLVKILEKYDTDNFRFGDINQRVMARWSSLAEASRNNIGKALESNAIDKLPLAERIVASDMRKVVNFAGRKAVDAKLIPKEVFERNKGTYLRRMYEYFNNPEYVTQHPELGLEKFVGQVFMPGQSLKIGRKFFEERGKDFALKMSEVANQKTVRKLIDAGITSPKALVRQDAPKLAKILKKSEAKANALLEKTRSKLGQKLAEYERFRVRYGELGPESAGFRAGLGSKITFEEAGKAQAFSELAKDAEIVSPNVERLSKALPEARLRYGNHTNLPLVRDGGKEWIKMPESKNFGDLSGKWMSRWDAKEILQMNDNRGKFIKMYDAVISSIKAGKVVWSSAAQGRNLVSNIMLMTYSGIPATKAMEYAAKGFGSVATKDKWYKQYVKLGGKGKTYGETEMFKAGTPLLAQTKLQKGMEKIKGAMSVPGKMYSGVEETYKIGAMRYWVETQGKSMEEAFKLSQEALFDYKALPPFLKDVVRRWAIPFVAFPAKALPFTAKTALRNPHRLTGIVSVKDMWNGYMKEKLGIEDRDWRLIEKKHGKWAIIVGGNKKNPEIMDSSYTVPGIPDFMSEGSRGLLGESKVIPQAIQPSQFWLPMIEAGMNKSSYFGNEIRKPGSFSMFDKTTWNTFKKLIDKGYTPLQAAKATLGNTGAAQTMAYLWRAYAPANVLVPGTYQSSQLTAFLKDLPDYSGTKPTFGSILKSSAGFKTKSLDVQDIRKYDQLEFEKMISSLRKQKRNLNKSKKMSKTEKEAAIEAIQEQIINLRKKRRKERYGK
jgi:hypothetical protein